MEKPAFEEHSSEESRLPEEEAKTNTDAATSPETGGTRPLRTYAWWLVLGLVGLDCFSTLGYLPTLAVEGTKDMAPAAPLAAVLVAVLLLCLALPIYFLIVGRSPQGRGATGLLENYLSGWSGKLFLLLLLGFVATDFVMTRTLSTADAAKHLLANPYAQSGVEWMLHRKDVVQDALPELLQGETTDRIFAWWDGQLLVTIVLMLFGFVLSFFLLRGFTRGFLYAAAALVALFLLLNGLVIGSSIVYLVRHPDYGNNWLALLSKGSSLEDPLLYFGTLLLFAIRALPWLVLGLSGFELSMAAAPLVQGKLGENPIQPRGRIRNMRKLLVATALLMAVFVPTSVTAVTFLVPRAETAEGGSARDRALAYLAHGGPLRPPEKWVRSENVPQEPMEENDGEGEGEADVPPRQAREQPKASAPPLEALPAQTGADLNPLFGPAFGTLYDLSAVLILCLAGASATITLRDLLPKYLTRYGMEMHWAQRIGVLMHLFNVLVLIVVIAFQARVAHQQGAYATSVLVLLAAAALAALIDLLHRWRRSLLRDAAVVPLFLTCVVFFLLACWVSYETPAGLVIALLFVAVLLVSAGVSRWMRSTELRYHGFTFADEETGIRWEQIRRLEFQVLVPYRPDEQALADREAAIRARHRIAPDVPIIFIETELGDPSDFQQHPLMQIVQREGREIIRVSDCASIAHVLAAIALEFREIGRPPEMHFTWSEESPLASNLNFLLWGQGNIPWMVHALIRKAEPDPVRQPRVIVG